MHSVCSLRWRNPHWWCLYSPFFLFLLLLLSQLLVLVLLLKPVCVYLGRVLVIQAVAPSDIFMPSLLRPYYK